MYILIDIILKSNINRKVLVYMYSDNKSLQKAMTFDDYGSVLSRE